eukprot:SAG22_NODE_1812_length_3525_cov_1.386165_3_plen_165_part_00
MTRDSDFEQLEVIIAESEVLERAPRGPIITDGGGITVVRNFLPPQLYSAVVDEFDRSHKEASTSANGTGVQSGLFHRRGAEQLVPFKLRVSDIVQKELYSLCSSNAAPPQATDPSHGQQQLLMPDHNSETRSVDMVGRIQSGDHHEHKDVTCDGTPVDGPICLL